MTPTVPLAVLTMVVLAASTWFGSAIRPELAVARDEYAGLRADSLIEGLRNAVSSAAATDFAATQETISEMQSLDPSIWTDQQKALMSEIVDTIVGQLIPELETSQAAGQAAVNDALASVQKANDEIMERLSDTGSIGSLGFLAQSAEQDFTSKLGVHKNLLDDLNSKQSEILGFLTLAGSVATDADADAWAGCSWSPERFTARLLLMRANGGNSAKTRMSMAWANSHILTWTQTRRCRLSRAKGTYL